jgi:hypothetical protein
MTDFVIARNMAISNTLFQHKRIHKEAWRSPDETTNQTDHMMIDSHHTTDILDVKSCRRADCDSDHFMVKIKYRQRTSLIGKSKAQRCTELNVDNLRNGITAQEYRNEVEDLLQTLPDAENQTVETAGKISKSKMQSGRKYFRI